MRHLLHSGSGFSARIKRLSVNRRRELTPSLPFINPEDIIKQLGERIHGATRQLA